jgi:hypothetical protein
MTKRRRSNDCRCGSGAYCVRHKRYGYGETISSGYELRVNRDPHLYGETGERCGGGRRVVRKRVGVS